MAADRRRLTNALPTRSPALRAALRAAARRTDASTLMSASAAHAHRPTTGAYAWFGMMIVSWTAFGLLAVTSEQTLAEAWDWVRSLPLVAEIVVWILTLPWTLALAVWESAWGDEARTVVVLLIAAAGRSCRSRGAAPAPSRSNPAQQIGRTAGCAVCAPAKCFQPWPSPSPQTLLSPPRPWSVATS